MGQCTLIEFESERDVELFARFVMSATSAEAGNRDTRLRDSVIKKFENNQLPGMFHYGRFLFITGDPRLTDRIRAALP